MIVIYPLLMLLSSQIFLIDDFSIGKSNIQINETFTKFQGEIPCDLVVKSLVNRTKQLFFYLDALYTRDRKVNISLGAKLLGTLCWLFPSDVHNNKFMDRLLVFMHKSNLDRERDLIIALHKISHPHYIKIIFCLLVLFQSCPGKFHGFLVKLYADFAPQKLMNFLETSDQYSIQEALGKRLRF